MPREQSDQSPEILSESDFFQRVKKRTAGTVYWERVEPSNESGFPDTHFVIRSRGVSVAEGTVEFKYKEGSGAPNLAGDMMRGTQKSALIDYHAQGGNRRYVVVYNRGDVWVFNTADGVKSIVGGACTCTGLGRLEEPAFVAWLCDCLRK